MTPRPWVINPAVWNVLVTRSFQTAGLITQGRGVITITDRPGLEEVACECYGTIRRNFERLLPCTYRNN